MTLGPTPGTRADRALHPAIFAVLIALVASAAGVLLTAPTPSREFMGLQGLEAGFPFDSIATATAAGGLVAVIVAAVARRAVDALFVLGTGVVGLALCAVTYPPAAVIAVAAGAVLGAVSIIAAATERRWDRGALIGGFVAGALVAPMLGSIRRGDPTVRRYADYTMNAQTVSFPRDVALSAAAVIAVVAFVIVVVAHRRRPLAEPARPDLRTAAVVIAIPVLGALAYWWLLHWVSSSTNDSTGLHIFLGGYLLVAVLVVAAVIAPGRSGLIWVAVAAVVAARAVDGVSGTGLSIAITTAVLVLVGAALGLLGAERHAPRTTIVALISLIALTAIKFIDDGVFAPTSAIAGVFAIPLIAAAAMTSAGRYTGSQPTSILVSGLVALPILTRVAGTELGWTAYTPLTDADDLDSFGGVSYSAATQSSIVVALITTVVCALTAVVLLRRSDDQRD